LKIIDLFSGCGGLSKGFEMAGFKASGSVEFWEPAIKTHKVNFPDCKFLGSDITKISNQEIISMRKETGLIDGIVGGPPCQGFSTIGRRDRNDPRNSLFKDFLRFVQIFNPSFFLMENVKGLLSTKTGKGENVIDIIFSEFDKIGYKCQYFLLNAADYGVPQLRERVFVFGSKKGLINVPPKTNNDLNYLSIEDAIGNLPPLDLDNPGFDRLKIDLNRNNKYQDYLMKNSLNVLSNHLIKKPKPKDVERSKYVPEGRYIRSTRGGLKNDIFPDSSLHLGKGEMAQQKYCRLDRSLPSWTVLTDWHTMRQKIHYEQNRPFSIREVARFQSFCDDFIFDGKKIQDYYQMIGNAVPPLLAFSIAKEIKIFLNSENYVFQKNRQSSLFN